MAVKYLLILFLIVSINIQAQQSRLSVSVNRISEYIASDYFGSMLHEVDHIALLDTLYLKSLTFNNNNISEALLSLTFASIPYKRVPVTIPLINITLYYPLVSADDSVFLKKNKNLPSRFFFDSPEGEFGDKDKIAHFFGNAFIGYHSTFLDISIFLGLFVEVFEETFQVQNEIDERDLSANYYGRAFGKALKGNMFVLPSQSLILYPLLYTFYWL
jgi:hypothetical protein